MTYQTDCTLPDELLEQIADQGLDVLPELIRTVINTAMQIERQQFLNASPYERSPERRGHANGYKPKTVTTRVGQVTFDVPQVRDSSFYPQALEKGLRSERALKLALAEMYVQGVSTRRVAAITEKLIGTEVTSVQVSRAVAELDHQLQAWRERPLGRYKYLWLDARYEKVRVDGMVRDAAVLMAAGLNLDGKREVLGVSISLSEAEIHWRSFLESLTQRGLTGVELITSDDHAGLEKARKAVFGGVPWQRCQFHLTAECAGVRASQGAEIRSGCRYPCCFQCSPSAGGRRTIGFSGSEVCQNSSDLADWMEENIPEGLTVFSFPEKHRRRLRTTNGLERLNREIRRRTRVAVLFPNTASCLRLGNSHYHGN